MGLDLRVYIDKYCGTMNEYFLGTESLSFYRDYDLFDKIREFNSKLITEEKIKFSEYSDTGLFERSDDPYGGPLTFVKAGQFSKISYTKNSWNNAVLQFLKLLPSETIVILYWY